MNGKLIAANVPSENHEAAQKFYSALLGVDFARSLTDEIRGYHVPISNDGHWLWISDKTAEDEVITCVFAVDNLDESMAVLREAGGIPFIEPFDMPISPQMMEFYEGTRRAAGTSTVTPTLGRSALMRDPDGNVIALCEIEEHAHEFFKIGEHRQPVSQSAVNLHNRVRRAGSKLE